MVAFRERVRKDVDECAEMTSQDTSLKVARMAGSREMGLPRLDLRARLHAIATPNLKESNPISENRRGTHGTASWA
ncbi:hypothetical protein V1478_008776 [Vespula squamosa]|uniref:Uncharacterized protein n=1 Tax=Vespula squamosa TaxID=30214 RepID=A0ABD2AUG8_VESSQ